jgi:hypothetical protein
MRETTDVEILVVIPRDLMNDEALAMSDGECGQLVVKEFSEELDLESSGMTMHLKAVTRGFILDED